MSHLGARLAAFVDGELPHGTRELVLAHLAMCPSCRAEVEAETRLKNGLTSLGGPDPSDTLMSSLLSLAGSAGPPSAVPPAPKPRMPAVAAPVAKQRPGPAGWAAFSPSRPGGFPSPEDSPLRPARRRQLVASVVSVAAVTLGAALFGGDMGETGPAVTPAELFAAQTVSTTDNASQSVSLLRREMAGGLPGTGFFQPVGALSDPEPDFGGFTGVLTSARSSAVTYSGFTGR